MGSAEELRRLHWPWRLSRGRLPVEPPTSAQPLHRPGLLLVAPGRGQGIGNGTDDDRLDWHPRPLCISHFNRRFTSKVHLWFLWASSVTWCGVAVMTDEERRRFRTADHRTAAIPLRESRLERAAKEPEISLRKAIHGLNSANLRLMEEVLALIESRQLPDDAALQAVEILISNHAKIADALGSHGTDTSIGKPNDGTDDGLPAEPGAIGSSSLTQ